MSYKEKIGLAFLFVACLYMAGLNLWLLFKDWFNENYAKKNSKDDIPNCIGKSKTIIGASKFNLEQERQKQNRLAQEVETLKRELGTIKKNEIIYSIPLEDLKEEKSKEHPLNGEPISSEEDIELNANYTKADVELAGSQSVTVDQFELMAKSLSGKTITSVESQQLAEIIPKMKGTSVFQQFLKQVKGAEEKVGEIMGREL